MTSNNVWEYYWTYDNRIASSTSGTATSTYGYDHSGIRVSLFDGTATTTYPNKYYNIAGATTTKHIFLGGQIIATIEGNGSATSTYYIHTDHLGGSSIITDSSGDIEQLIDYYPFGDMRLNETSGGFDEQRKFTGHEYDEDTGLNYMKARYQNPAVGRFVSVDPVHNKIGTKKFNELLLKNKYTPKNSITLIIWLSDNEEIDNNLLLYDYLTNPQILNSYSYVSNNPLIYTDPLGETESAEKVVNFISGRGWKSDLQLTDISKIPTMLVSPETAKREKTYISTPEHATNATLRAARPSPPSYNQRRKISNSLNKISAGANALGKTVNTQGFGASLTLTTASAVLPLGPEASMSVIVSYPVIEMAVRAIVPATTLLSAALGTMSNWLMNP
ncbi:RHS repeat-associated core domain-containing protein [Patescibacteria group bacterium]